MVPSKVEDVYPF